MMGFDVNYLMLFCGAPGRLQNFVTDNAGHRLLGLGGPESAGSTIAKFLRRLVHRC